MILEVTRHPIDPGIISRNAESRVADPDRNRAGFLQVSA